MNTSDTRYTGLICLQPRPTSQWWGERGGNVTWLMTHLMTHDWSPASHGGHGGEPRQGWAGNPEPRDKWGAQRDIHWNMMNILYFLLLSFYLRRLGWDVMALNMVKSDRELHCNGTTFKSKINGRWTLQPQWARFELNSKCSISTPDLSVGTRFSCYKGCRAVGTKINKILNCYLPFCRGWEPAPANVQILHLAWSRKCSCWGGFREEWTAIFFVKFSHFLLFYIEFTLRSSYPNGQAH